MEKQYQVLEMPEAVGGHGIIATDFLKNDPKGRLWKNKSIFKGSFNECYLEKSKITKKAVIAA